MNIIITVRIFVEISAFNFFLFQHNMTSIICGEKLLQNIKYFNWKENSKNILYMTNSFTAF